MQFLDEFVCISTTGINNYAYSQLIDTTDKSALDVTEYSDEWNEVFELLEYSDDIAKKLAKYAVDNNLTIPKIGFEMI